VDNLLVIPGKYIKMTINGVSLKGKSGFTSLLPKLIILQSRKNRQGKAVGIVGGDHSIDRVTMCNKLNATSNK